MNFHENIQDGKNQFFCTLIEPAKVSVMPNLKEWKLEEKGSLNFAIARLDKLLSIYT